MASDRDEDDLFDSRSLARKMWSRLDLLLYELKPAMDSSLSQCRPYYGAVEIHICTTVNILPPLALEEAVVFLTLLIIKKNSCQVI